MDDVKMHGPANVVLVIVGNKTDVLDHQVSPTEGQTYADENHAVFRLTSAK
jgi:GTPase SAR1 family protein